MYRSRISALVLLTSLTACTGKPADSVGPQETRSLMQTADSHEHEGGDPLSPQIWQAVAAVRKATTKYHDFNAALADGWTEQSPPGCASSPSGAQGLHYLNPSLVDGEVDLLRPELLMYEPQQDGSMQLVGVDYIIPFAQWQHADPPTLLGQPLMRIEPLGVWAIHIWAWRPNPSGMFAPWNPRVSCAQAAS